MSADEKLSGKLGVDTTDFKTAMAAANRELRVLESGFRASAAALGDWSNSATGLEARAKSLTAQMDVQRGKVERLQAEHQRLVDAHGANSRAAQDAEIKLNKETETLNKMGVELQETTSSLDAMQSGADEAADSVEDLGGASEDASGSMFSFRDALSALGGAAQAAVSAIAAVGAAAVAAVGLMAGLALNTASVAEHFTDLSNKTGISAERLQELTYAGEILGTSIDTITGAQSRLIRSMDGAAEQALDYQTKIDDAAKSGKSLEDIELGGTAQAFASLGVQVRDAGGSLRDSEQVFAEVIDALGRVENPTERDALAMQIFGKSAQELNPLIKAGSAELAALSEEAHKMGAVMSEEDVAAAATFQDTLDGLKMGFQGVVAQIGLAFLPGLSGVADQAKGYLQELVGIVQGGGGDFGQIAEGLGGLIGRIATDLAQQSPKLMQAGLGIVQNILKAITGALPTLLPAATQVLTTLIQFIAQNLPVLIGAAVPILLTLVNALVQNFPMIVTAAIQAVIALAQGLSQALPTLIPAVVQAIITIVTTLLENLPMLIDAALQLILGLAQGLITALPILIAAIPQIVKAIFDALIKALPLIANAAVELITALGRGILANIPVLLTSLVELTGVVVRGISNLSSEMLKAGKNIVVGLWNGMKGNLDWLLSNVMGFADSVVDAVKTALGMQSPSKVFRGIGANAADSIGLGLQDALPSLTRAFAGAANQLAAAAQVGVSGSPVTNMDNSFDVWGNVIIQGDTPAGSLGAALRGRRF